MPSRLPSENKLHEPAMPSRLPSAKEEGQPAMPIRTPSAKEVHFQPSDIPGSDVRVPAPSRAPSAKAGLSDAPPEDSQGREHSDEMALVLSPDQAQPGSLEGSPSLDWSL
jgi:hypothetical protein